MRIHIELDSGSVITKEVDTCSWWSANAVDCLEARDTTGRVVLSVPHAHIVSYEVVDPEPTSSEEAET